MAAIVKLLQPGAAKPRNNPYTVCILANPALETPLDSGNFSVDPITAQQARFDAAAAYVLDTLLGHLPGQKDTTVGTLAPDFRVVSIFEPDLPATDANALVGEDSTSDIVVARQERFADYLARHDIDGEPLKADVVYAVTASATHSRCSAWFTRDDDSQGGVAFTIDGATRHHRYENLDPGTVALHVTAYSLTALHEFGHAASSWTNGMIIDLYVDNRPGFNNKRRAAPNTPRPRAFCSYRGTAYKTDAARDGLGYPRNWWSFHCELTDPAQPAAMDDYWKAGGGPAACQHDRVTRQFLFDRISAIMSRP